MDIRIIGSLVCNKNKIYLNSLFSLRHSIGTIKTNIENLDRWGFHEIIVSLKDGRDISLFKEYCKQISEIKIFTPLILIGGISDIDRIKIALNSGFDRVGFCSSLLVSKKIKFINYIADTIGAQAVLIQFIIKEFNSKFVELYIPNSGKIKKINHNDLKNTISEVNASEIIITDYYSDGENKLFRKDILKLQCFRGINKNILCGYGVLNDKNKLIINKGISGAIVGDSIFHKENFIKEYALK